MGSHLAFYYLLLTTFTMLSNCNCFAVTEKSHESEVRKYWYSQNRVVCGNDKYAQHVTGDPRAACQNDLTGPGFSLRHTYSVRTRSSVTIHPLQYERTVERSGIIDIPSTACCVATISMLSMWQRELHTARQIDFTGSDFTFPQVPTQSSVTV